jgi:hypothetical protein
MKDVFLNTFIKSKVLLLCIYLYPKFACFAKGNDMHIHVQMSCLCICQFIIDFEKSLLSNFSKHSRKTDFISQYN